MLCNFRPGIFARIFCAFVCLLHVLPVFSQSPWTRSKAGLYAQATIQTLPGYSTVFGEKQTRQPLERTLSETAFQLYAEYGFSKKLTFTGALPIRRFASGAALDNNTALQSGTYTGLGNPVVTARRQLTDGRLPFTATLRVEWPVDRYEDRTGVRTGYRAFTFEPLLSTGMGFGSWYWFGYAGYGIRTHQYSHFFQAGAEAGVEVRKARLMLFTDWVRPFRNGSILLPPPNALTYLYVDRQGWQALGLKASVSMGRFWGLHLAAITAIRAQNVPRQAVYSAGAWFKWD